MSARQQPALYPPADAKTSWFGTKFPTTDMGGVDKVLLHTTEGVGWPGYHSGAMAPNLTYHPAQRQWRQHFPLYRSSRALRDDPATAVRENRDRVCQVEIIAICDVKLAKRVRNGLYVGDLSPEALGDLGDFLAFMHQHFATPLVAAPRWLPYPRSYGNSNVRMSGRQYAVYRGVLGHQHASGNAHGDPGCLDVPTIMRRAGKKAVLDNAHLVPAPTPTLPPALAVRPPEDAVPDAYRLLKTPDGRFWGMSGLQCTHLETSEILREYLTTVGLKLDDARAVSYEFIGNLQRIT